MNKARHHTPSTSEKKKRKRFWTWKKSLGLGIFNYLSVAISPILSEIGWYVASKMDPPRTITPYKTLMGAILYGLEIDLQPAMIAVCLTPAVIAGISVYLGK